MLAAPDSRMRTLAIAGRVVGLAIVISGIGLGIRLSDVLEESLDLKLMGFVLGGSTVVNYGLIILAVCQRLSPGRYQREIGAWLMAMAALLVAANLWLAYEIPRSFEDAGFWTVISSLTVAAPLAPPLLLALTALPAADERLLGRPSRAGVVLAVASMAGVVALAIQFVSLPYIDDDVWRVITNSAGPLAAAMILLLASRPRFDASVDPVPLLARAIGVALFAAVLATGLWALDNIYPQGTPATPTGYEPWLFLTLVIPPAALIFLAAEVGHGTPAHPTSALFGIIVAVSAIALALRFASTAQPVEMFQLAISGSYGNTAVVAIATSGSATWKILGTVSLPIALATLQIMLGLGRSSTPSPRDQSEGLEYEAVIEGAVEEEVVLDTGAEPSLEDLQSWSRPRS